MNKENFAELQIREYQKLRNFIETLDIPMREKESIIWRIESAEKEAITSICKNIQDEALKKLKENL